MGIASGLTSEGDRSRGASNEANRWMFNRGQNAFGRADQQYGAADWQQKYLDDFYGGMSQGQFGTADELTQRGRDIMPWLDPMLDRRMGRVGQMSSNYEGIGPVSDTTGALSQATDQYGAGINRTADAISGDITDLRGRSFGREGEFSRDLIGNYQGGFGALRGNADTSFGATSGATGEAYDKAMDYVRPGSEFRAATAARAFSPQVASTMMRLRRAGIDPASVEGQSLLRGVESSRARAMDDQLGGAYDRLGQLRINKAGQMGDIERDRLMNDQGLGLGELDAVTGEKLRSLGAQQGMDRDFTTMGMDNRNLAFDRETDYHRQRKDDALASRDLEERDVNNRNRFLDLANQEDAYASEQQLGRYNQGVDAQGRDIDYRLTGAQGYQQGANTRYNQANFQDQYGAGAFGQAQQGFDRTVAGAANPWTGVITGAAAAGLDAYAPGSGNIIRNATGQAPVSARTPGYNPNAANPGYYGGNYAANSAANYNLNTGNSFRAGGGSRWGTPPPPPPVAAQGPSRPPSLYR